LSLELSPLFRLKGISIHASFAFAEDRRGKKVKNKVRPVK